MELIKIAHKYVNKKGDEVVGYNYALRLDNGNYIAVKPVFDRDYSKFYLIAKNK